MTPRKFLDGIRSISNPDIPSTAALLVAYIEGPPPRVSAVLLRFNEPTEPLYGETSEDVGVGLINKEGLR